MSLTHPITVAGLRAREKRLNDLWFGIEREIQSWAKECMPLQGQERQEYLDRLNELAYAVGKARAVLARALLRIEPPQPSAEKTNTN